MATVSSIKTKMTSDRYITATLDYVTKKFVELDKSEGEEIYKYYLSLTEKSMDLLLMKFLIAMPQKVWRNLKMQIYIFHLHISMF